MSVAIQETRDYELLAKLNRQVQELHHKMYPKLFKPYDQEGVTKFFHDLFQKPEATAFLAVKNGEVLGYVLLLVRQTEGNAFAYPRSFIELDQILVLEEHRGTGAGKLLLDRVAQLSETLGVKRIELNHWTDNEDARAFFSKHGFQYCKEVMYKEE